MLVRTFRIVSAILLLGIGGIHGALVALGAGGFIGIAFILNAIAGIVLAIGMVALRGRVLAVGTVLSLLFAIASLVAILLALTVGLFGVKITPAPLVNLTVVVDALAVVATAITTRLVLRAPARAAVAA